MKRLQDVSREMRIMSSHMAITERRRLGNVGEDIAVRYLEQKGYEVVARNFQRPWGEIDIVARRDGVYRMVEVKTISREKGHTENLLTAEDHVHPKKLDRLSRIAETYMEESGSNAEYQIDLVAVELDHVSRRAHCTLYEQLL